MDNSYYERLNQQLDDMDEEDRIEDLKPPTKDHEFSFIGDPLTRAQYFGLFVIILYVIATWLIVKGIVFLLSYGAK